MKRHLVVLAGLALAGAGTLPAQSLNPIIVEAESGGPDASVYSVLTTADGTFVRVVADFADVNHPGTASRVLSYTVTFPEPGVYRLYGRMRIGGGGGNDDSFFYGNGFGAKTFNDGNDWVTVNNLVNGGFVLSSDTVVGDTTTSGGTLSGFRWFDLSRWSGGVEAPAVFTVPAGQLTQTFQIGSRENGLDIDKFAFGAEDVYFTVGNLNAGAAGTLEPPPPPPPPFDPPGPPVAEGKDKFLGSAHSPAQAVNFDKYWNQVTPENAGKWGSVEGTRDVMNWGQLDTAYDLAKSNGFPFRFHVLVWGNQQPAWMTMTHLLGDPELRRQEQLAEIHEWFAAVAERYPDIDFLEVVNEPLHDPPSGAHPSNSGGNYNSSGDYFEALGGAGETGWDWVINAFTLAREYFPNAKLTLNDYSITNTNGSTTQYLAIINLLQERGLIDIIGIQGHAFSTTGSMVTHEANLDRLAETGLPIHVTEMDIDGPTDAIQLQQYQRIFPTFWEHPGVDGVTLWGWRIGHWRTSQGAYLALANGAERPALEWLRAYVNTPIVHAGQSFAIDGGTSNAVGTVLASYPDGTLHESNQDWQVVGGDGAGIFDIDPVTGVLKILNASAIDFDRSQYSLFITASHDAYTSEPVEVVLTIPAHKIRVWHKEKNVIVISKNAVHAHLAQGGKIGGAE